MTAVDNARQAPDFTMLELIHAALRRDLVRLAGALEEDLQPRRARLVARQWQAFSLHLHDHHTAEDRFVWPVIEKRANGEADEVLAGMRAEHSVIDPLLERADDAFSQLAADPDPLNRGHASAVLAEVTRVLEAHLRHEERDAVPLAERFLLQSDLDHMAEVQRREGGIRGALSFLPWVLEGAPEDVQRRFLGGLPPPLQVRAARARRRHQREVATAFGSPSSNGRSFMGRMTRWVLGHQALVVVGWLLIAIAGGATASGTVHRLSQSYAIPGQPGAVADAEILQHYGNGGEQEPLVPVITLPAGESVHDAGVQSTITRVLDAARVDDTVRVVDFASTQDSAFVTNDGRSTYALVFTPRNANIDVASPLDGEIESAVKKAAPPGWTVQVTGIRELINGAPSTQGAGVIAESMIGAIGALVVLLFVFASLLVALPLAVAGISILSTFLLLAPISAATQVSFIVEYLIALIGLGVAIDYTLLVLTRWREERARGRDREEAVVAAMESAGRAVVFSGFVVAIGLLAMVILPVPFLRSIGYAGMLIPLVSMAVTVTFLPVLLARVGHRLEWPHRRSEKAAGRLWMRWAAFVHRRRIPAAIAGLIVLGLLAAPLSSLRLGEPLTSTLSSDGPARAALDTLTTGGVPSGALTPMEVVVHGDPAAVAGDLATLPGVRTAVVAAPEDASGTALVDVLPTAEAGQSSGKQTVIRVRDSVASDPAAIGVAGAGPSTIDAVHSIYGNFPLMLGLIALVTFLVLARALRSVALAFKAVLLNVLSVAAAYGVLVAVWQWGWGSHAVWGVTSTGAITFWVPLFVFAFLFGLSMDYEVFILARIREGYDRSGSTATATVEGVARTGRLVTSAALILAFAFLAMSTGPATDMKILATGLGAGILVDAFVVRTLLVPALVALIGRWNWWLPVPLPACCAWRRPRPRGSRWRGDRKAGPRSKAPTCRSQGRTTNRRTTGRRNDDEPTPDPRAGHHCGSRRDAGGRQRRCLGRRLRERVASGTGVRDDVHRRPDRAGTLGVAALGGSAARGLGVRDPRPLH